MVTFKKPKTVFHITLKENLSSILDNGFNPDLSKGHLKASWFVDRYRIKWAIRHTLEKHPHLTPNDLVIIRAELKRGERKHLKRFHQKGLFYSKAPFYPVSYQEVSL